MTEANKHRLHRHISATIITHNEESVIERCLNSLLGVVDEIIVVDSNSTDKTLEICRRYNCKITQRPFYGYGSQRQYACGLTKHSYVLSIDADEVLSEELRDSIRLLKDSGFSHRMYSTKIINYICGQALKHCGLHPQHNVRLFDKRYATWDLHDVGERLTYSDSINPAVLPGCIYHYKCSTYDELDFKEMRHSKIHARVLAAKNANVGAVASVVAALKTYLRTHIRQFALLDGKTGHKIALARYKSTIAAYRTARKIINTNERQERC